jgi:hypothetical protein
MGLRAQGLGDGLSNAPLCRRDLPFTRCCSCSLRRTVDCRRRPLQRCEPGMAAAVEPRSGALDPTALALRLEGKVHPEAGKSLRAGRLAGRSL